MKVRFTFRAELYIEGDTMKEIAHKYESTPLFSEEAKTLGADFIELISVEEADTCKDLTREYYEC